jgi:hypothetical protein
VQRQREDLRDLLEDFFKNPCEITQRTLVSDLVDYGSDARDFDEVAHGLPSLELKPDDEIFLNPDTPLEDNFNFERPPPPPRPPLARTR